MVNNRIKGNRNEAQAVKDLEAQGYLVYRVKGSTKWNTNVDIFGIFDILGIRKNESLLVQVKTNVKPNLRIYEEFHFKYPQFNVQVWVKTDYKKGFVVYKCG